MNFIKRSGAINPARRDFEGPVFSLDKVIFKLVVLSLVISALVSLLGAIQRPGLFLLTGGLLGLLLAVVAFERWQKNRPVYRGRAARRNLAAISLLLTTLLAEGVVLGPLAASPDKIPAASAAGLAGLKNSFMFGLANKPGDLSWMVTSQIPWDMRYQFLIGDVTAHDGWVAWNQPDGAFASYYMNESAANNYLPVFTFYSMYYSSPGKFEARENLRSLVNLKTPATMRGYFEKFKLLMDRIKLFGKPVIVQVEPDFWGFVHQAAVDDNPATVPAAINSSGYGDVAAGRPDNVSGFAQSLVALRDKYAPNAVLALHISPWSSGFDITTNTNATLDIAAISARTARFYNALGAKYDMLTLDAGDRDAAYYSGSENPWWRHSWDMDSKILPHFEQYRTYLQGLTSQTGLKAMLIGVPMGNRIYRTMNNTANHWQDNRVEYFVGPNYKANLQLWINSGLIGILWGDGASDQTTYLDRKGDGITNPEPINGNIVVSTVADDDGGYLRERGRNYYQSGPVTLGNTAPLPAPAPVTTAPPTSTATATALATATPAPKPTSTPAPVPTATTAAPTSTPVPATIAPTATPRPTVVPISSPPLKLEYRTENTKALDAQVEPRFNIVNATSSPVPLSEIKLRYWYTLGVDKPQNYYCDYAPIGCANIKAQFVRLATPVNGADGYLELSFTAAAGNLAASGKSGELINRFAKSDWTNYDENSHYSYDPTRLLVASEWNRVTLYRNNTLVWGVEPR